MTKVLLGQADLISSVGGGESASRRLYGQPGAPETVWPMTNGTLTTLPPNFDRVSYPSKYAHWINQRLRKSDWTANHAYDFAQALVMAEIAAETDCRFVEVPEYLTFSRFLPAALANQNRPDVRVVVSMHGRVSETLRWERIDQYDGNANLIRELRFKENCCFRAADHRYAISESHRDATSDQGMPVSVVDPWLALHSPLVQNSPDARLEPHAVFIGRIERLKGLDLFMQMIWESRHVLERRHIVYGRAVRPLNSFPIGEILNFCRFRGIRLNYKGEASYDRLCAQVFHQPSLVVVPSRYDSFNLVAMEALLHGQPVMVSKQTGVHRFLERVLPDHEAWTTFEIADPGSNAGKAIRMMESYQALHRALRDWWHEHQPDPDLASLQSVFQQAPQSDPEVRGSQSELFLYLLRQLRGTSKPFLDVAKKPSHFFSALQLSAFRRRPRLQTVSDTKMWLEHLPDALGDSEFAREESLRMLHGSLRLEARHRILQRLAEIERRRGRLDISTAYRLRLVRWHGSAAPCEISLLKEDLNILGMPTEASLLPVWHAEAETAQHTALNYLQNQLDCWRPLPQGEYSKIFDHRNHEKPKVTVIVSLYEVNRDALDHFCSRLSRQTMFDRKASEVIFVDSGSPTNQLQVLEAAGATRLLPALLVRTSKRETIQMAWNRAVALARGEALVFLGVDEGLRPDALDILWEALEGSPPADWVTSDAVVTRVDSNGRLIKDLMKYSRKGLNFSRLLVDPTYLGMVGGMHRAELHAKKGLFDPTFKGAGDTEFKMRALPGLKLRHIPDTLGEFFDYPANRTTNSAAIEIEDSRAWYIFRSPGGIKYLFASEGPELLAETFWTSVSAGRCWLNGRPESDLHFALNLLEYARERSFALPELDLIGKIRRLTSLMRGLLLADMPHPKDTLSRSQTVLRESQHFFERCSAMRPDLEFPVDIRTDMLYESHGWLW